MRSIGKFFKERKWRNDGYLTIEMTIIFPVIFFSLLLILFMGIVLYQEVEQQSLAVQASERGAVVYSSRVSDMSTGVKNLEDFKIRDPYRNVPFMDGGGKQSYVSLVNAYVAEREGGRDVLSGELKNKSYTEIEDYLVAKRVKVTIDKSYHTPVDSIAAMFGHEGPFDVHTSAVSAVTDSPDFVRNVDIVGDIARQTKVFGSMDQGYGKIREAIAKAKDLLE